MTEDEFDFPIGKYIETGGQVGKVAGALASLPRCALGAVGALPLTGAGCLAIWRAFGDPDPREVACVYRFIQGRLVRRPFRRGVARGEEFGKTAGFFMGVSWGLISLLRHKLRNEGRSPP